eukprot:TRINITY_DN22734_c0_g1_i1.p1 TRINITY_DN22734_c0_g1~~TRINITY_DN22734_c0_g1_i1.p1  ORF type:complete len:148 (-),score=49.88 TRINITY_DN22734_c0_g1_i1:74-517(-)
MYSYQQQNYSSPYQQVNYPVTGCSYQALAPSSSYAPTSLPQQPSSPFPNGLNSHLWGQPQNQLQPSSVYTSTPSSSTSSSISSSLSSSTGETPNKNTQQSTRVKLSQRLSGGQRSDHHHGSSSLLKKSAVAMDDITTMFVFLLYYFL